MSTLSTLGIVFIILKLLGYISWSWLLVISPFLVLPLFVILLIVIQARLERK